MSGKLVVAATPIGNLGDVTPRVLEALRTADVVLAEDTRVTAKLLARYEIAAKVERCDDNVIAARTPAIVERIQAGETVVLVSDAGTPGVSDPGSYLVVAAIEAGLDVEVLPGPSAVITALVASGLPTEKFYFGGFLPRKGGQRSKALAALAQLDATLIFYESPHRSAASLAAIAEAFPGRQAALARELTKMHEEVVRGPVADVAAKIAARESLKGEVVLLVGPPVATKGAVDPETVDSEEVASRVEALLASGLSKSETVKSIAREFSLPRNSAYAAVHGIALREK